MKYEYNSEGLLQAKIDSGLFSVLRCALGSNKRNSHGFRHRKAQMKALVRGRFTGKGARFGL